MIRIKFEVEEEETPLPIESENERIKRILSLKFFGNNLNNSTSDNTNNGNNNNVCGTLKQKLLPELNGMVPKKVVVVSKNKPKQLDNSTTDSVAALVGCSKSIKTEPVESSLSLTTQLNNSLNIQSLLRQNRIQNGWTTNEQSIPIGTQQQQQQSLFSTKIEPIFPAIHQEVPLSLDQSFSSILNLNPNPGQTITTTNCDTMETSCSRAGFDRREKLNVCYSVPMEPNQFTTTTTAIQRNSDSADNLESTNNDDNYSDQDFISGSGSISGLDPTSESFSTGPSPPPPEAAVPLLVGKKPLPLGKPPLTLEEKKARKRERNRLWYYRQKANLKQSLDPEVMAEKLPQGREYYRKQRQHRLANVTPEQREQRRLKEMEKYRRRMKKETEEQRKQRLEQAKQYGRTVAKRRREQLLATVTPEQREQIRLKQLERVRRQRENETDEKRQRELERGRQYKRTVAKQRREQKRQTINDTGKSLEQPPHLGSRKFNLEIK